MKVCEECGGVGCSTRLYYDQPITVMCGRCHGTGLICLGHESAARYDDYRTAALAKAIREGWYEQQGYGDHQRLVLIGPAEFVQCEHGSAKDVA